MRWPNRLLRRFRRRLPKSLKILEATHAGNWIQCETTKDRFHCDAHTMGSVSGRRLRAPAREPAVDLAHLADFLLQV